MSTYARAAIVAIAAGTAAAGCFLITGGTGGYELAPPEAGICSIDAGVTVTCACASSSDCLEGGRQFCCFGLSTTTLSASSSCQATPCDAAAGPQLCKMSSECVDASCTLQTCSFDSLSIPVQICGTLAGCTP